MSNITKLKVVRERLGASLIDTKRIVDFIETIKDSLYPKDLEHSKLEEESFEGYLYNAQLDDFLTNEIGIDDKYARANLVWFNEEVSYPLSSYEQAKRDNPQWHNTTLEDVFNMIKNGKMNLDEYGRYMEYYNSVRFPTPYA